MVYLRSVAGWAAIDAPILLLVLCLSAKLLVDEKSAQIFIKNVDTCGLNETVSTGGCSSKVKRSGRDSLFDDLTALVEWSPNSLGMINKVVAYTCVIIACLSLRFLLQLVPIVGTSRRFKQQQDGKRQNVVLFNVLGYSNLVIIVITLVFAALHAAAMAKAEQLGVAIQSIHFSFLLISLLIGTGVSCGLITGKKGLEARHASNDSRTELGDSERGSIEKL